MRIEIAPDFYCDDWEELATKLDPDGEWGKSPATWKRAIEVIQGRIQTRFLSCADKLQDTPYAGFAKPSRLFEGADMPKTRANRARRTGPS